MDTPPRILLTRPRHVAEGFAERFAPSVEVHISPLLRITDTPVTEEIDRAATLLFTSSRGVEAAERQNLGIGQTAFCVGQETARIAQELGYPAISADGDVEALFGLCLRSPKAAPFWHLRGLNARGDLCSRLNDAGLASKESVVYQQDKLDLDSISRHWIADDYPVILPIFSPMTAKLLSQNCDPGPMSQAVVMSHRVFEALSPAWQGRATVAPHPSARVMEDEILKALSQPPSG